ncbi:phage tail protein [Paenibacillus sp. MER 99-2]|nr:phage tail protein [Paenibacillus sp. MER 99-2]
MQRLRRINSDDELTFLVPMTSEDFESKIHLKGHVEDERGQLYVVNSIQRVRDGRKLTAQIKCRHVKFKLVDYKVSYASYISEAYGVPITRLTDIVTAATNGRFTFSIDDTFPLFDVKDWGRTNALEALNGILTMYGAEMEADNFVIHLRKKIGENKGMQYRIRKNIITSTYSSSGESLCTRMFAQMKDGRTWIGQPASILTADERARLAAIPGAIVNGTLQSNYLVSQYAGAWGSTDTPYYDSELIEQNLTNVTDLLREARKKLAENEVPALEVTVSAADVHKLEGYEAAPDLGDTVYCVDPEMGLDNITARIIEITEYPFARDRHTQVTIANVMRKDYAEIMADLDKTKQVVGNLVSGGLVRTEVFETFAKQAIKDVDASKTEVKYDSRGIVLQDRTDPRNQVIMTANGVVLSTDGGSTARTAITARGVLAETVVGQFGSFVSMLIGSGNNVTQINTNGIAAGHAVFSSAPFRVDMQGNVTANRLTANAAQILSSNLNASTWRDGVFTGNITAQGEISGGIVTGALTRTAANGRRIELDTRGFRAIDNAGRSRITIATDSDEGISGLAFFDSAGSWHGQVIGTPSNLTISARDGLYVSGGTGPITLGSRVNFTYGIDIGVINGLQSQLEAMWQAINNHTHSVTLPTHNHGNTANQNWGGTFTTSRPA